MQNDSKEKTYQDVFNESLGVGTKISKFMLGSGWGVTLSTAAGLFTIGGYAIGNAGKIYLDERRAAKAMQAQQLKAKSEEAGLEATQASIRKAAKAQLTEPEAKTAAEKVRRAEESDRLGPKADKVLSTDQKAELQAATAKRAKAVLGDPEARQTYSRKNGVEKVTGLRKIAEAAPKVTVKPKGPRLR